MRDVTVHFYNLEYWKMVTPRKIMCLRNEVFVEYQEEASFCFYFRFQTREFDSQGSCYSVWSFVDLLMVKSTDQVRDRSWFTLYVLIIQMFAEDDIKTWMSSLIALIECLDSRIYRVYHLSLTFYLSFEFYSGRIQLHENMYIL